MAARVTVDKDEGVVETQNARAVRHLAGDPGLAFETRDSVTMQNLSPVRVADMSMMLSLACPHSEASGGGSLSTGKERDYASGNDYFGARYYSSNMGRFMSPDYSDDEDGPQAIPYYNPTSPQSLNSYLYVRNNPLTNVDSDGHDCVNASGASSGTALVQTTENASDCLQASPM